MKVSEVEIVPVKPKNGLVAFASFVLDDKIYCGSVGIMTRPKGGYRLIYPTRKTHGRDMGVFYPIDKTIGEYICRSVVEKYQEVMKEDEDVRHRDFEARAWRV